MGLAALAARSRRRLGRRVDAKHSPRDDSTSGRWSTFTDHALATASCCWRAGPRDVGTQAFEIPVPHGLESSLDVRRTGRRVEQRRRMALGRQAAANVSEQAWRRGQLQRSGLVVGDRGRDELGKPDRPEQAGRHARCEGRTVVRLRGKPGEALEALPCLLPATQYGKRRRSVNQGGDVLGREYESAVEVVQRIVGAVERRRCDPFPHQDVRLIGGERDRLIELSERLVELTQLDQHVAEVVLQRRRPRILALRATEVLERPLVLREAFVRNAELVQRLEVVALELDRTLERCDGLAAQALLQPDRAEREQRSRQAAGQRRRFQEHVFRSIGLASLEIDVGQQLERLFPMVATIQELAQQELAEVELVLRR